MHRKKRGKFYGPRGHELIAIFQLIFFLSSVDLLGYDLMETKRYDKRPWIQMGIRDRIIGGYS